MALLATTINEPAPIYATMNDGPAIRFNTYHNLSPRMAKARKLRKQLAKQRV
jgi:hypothetical protein